MHIIIISQIQGFFNVMLTFFDIFFNLFPSYIIYKIILLKNIQKKIELVIIQSFHNLLIYIAF